MEKLIWPITLVVCIVAGGLTAPGIIRAVKEPSVIVQPGPVVVDAFADDVAAAWKANGGTSEDACVLVDIYSAVIGVLANDTQGALSDTKKLGDAVTLGNTLAFGKPKPFDDKYQWLQGMIRGELLERGITTDANNDGRHDIVPVKRDAWVKLYGEVVEGLSK